MTKDHTCKRCGLPTKSPFASARKLTRFETSESDNTRTNKINYDFDRRLLFCNSLTCYKVDRPDYAELHRLAAQDLGPNYSRRAYLKWRKGEHKIAA
jgi:hypothetical protein